MGAEIALSKCGKWVNKAHGFEIRKSLQWSRGLSTAEGRYRKRNAVAQTRLQSSRGLSTAEGRPYDGRVVGEAGLASMEPRSFDRGGPGA